MAIRAYGVESVEIAPIGLNGALPTTGWLKITNIQDGSVTLTVPEVQTNDIRVEDIDGIVDVLPGDTEPATISVASLDIDVNKTAQLIGGDYESVGSIKTKGALTGGTGYTGAGTYKNVALTGGTGTGATADIVVAGGAVTTVTIVSKGIGYTAADSLSALAANIGGAGTGFTQAVATVGSATSYDAPSVGEIKHLAIRLTSRPHKGKKFQFHFKDAAIVSNVSATFTRNEMVALGFTAKSTTPSDAAGNPVSPWGWKVLDV